jgi:hypothetical protein
MYNWILDTQMFNNTSLSEKDQFNHYIHLLIKT